MATVIGAMIVFGLTGAIVTKMIYNKLHHKGGCSCGEDCSCCGGECRPKK